jgi:hypothetical protein
MGEKSRRASSAVIFVGSGFTSRSWVQKIRSAALLRRDLVAADITFVRNNIAAATTVH